MKAIPQLIKHLKKALLDPDIETIQDLQPLIASNQLDWEGLLKKENGHPKNTVLIHDEVIKVILIHWNPKQKSSKHGHPEVGGLVKVLSGTLKETLFDPEDTDKVIGEGIYKEGNISYIHDDIAFHTIENVGDAPAVSLHVYVKDAVFEKKLTQNRIHPLRTELPTAA